MNQNCSYKDSCFVT